MINIKGKLFQGLRLQNTFFKLKIPKQEEEEERHRGPKTAVWSKGEDETYAHAPRNLQK